jgi:hypothetical protein
MIAAQIDRETAAARCLAADRAVAEVERIGVTRAQAEPHGAAVTGALQQHDIVSPKVVKRAQAARGDDQGKPG